MKHILFAFAFLAGIFTASCAYGQEGCLQIAGKLENEYRIPPKLLQAVVTQESGGQQNIINVDGQDERFSSAQEAIARVQQLRRAGKQSIDVGCGQINLKHHPSAFSSLEEAFDPEVNLRYAARFLAALKEETGDWMTAVGRYHSADPGRARPYTASVLSIWRGKAEALVAEAGKTNTLRRVASLPQGVIGNYHRTIYRQVVTSASALVTSTEE